MAEDRRSRILDAAKERFGHYGFRKTGVDEIAGAVGISKRTLYEEFPSKEKILAEVLLHEAQVFSSHLAEELHRGETGAAQLEMLLRLTRGYFDQNPFLGKVLGDDKGMYAPFLEDEIEWVEHGIVRMIAGCLRRGAADGSVELGASEPGEAARAIFVVLRGFTYAARREEERGGSYWIDFTMRAIDACAPGERRSAAGRGVPGDLHPR